VVESRIHRKKLPIWPWLVGAALLILAAWAAAWLLDPEGEIEDPARLSTEGVEAPEPATIPAPANQ
jgi:hypothetical protein